MSNSPFLNSIRTDMRQKGYALKTENEYTEDFFSQENVEYREANRVRGEDPMKFSIELGTGWYLQYYFYP